MKLTIEDVEYEIEDVFHLIAIINTSASYSHQSIILQLLESADFRKIITKHSHLRSLFGSLEDHEIFKVIKYILSEPQEFQRLISTVYELNELVTVLKPDHAQSVIEHILDTPTEINRLIKDEEGFQTFINFLDANGSNIIDRIFSAIPGLDQDEFNRYMGYYKNLLIFSKKYPHLQGRLLNKTTLSNANFSQLLEFIKSIRIYEPIDESTRQRMLTSLRNRIMQFILDERQAIHFTLFIEIASNFLSDEDRTSLFKMMENNRQFLKSRIKTLDELIGYLKCLPAQLSYRLFHLILNDSELFRHFIRNNDTLYSLYPQIEFSKPENALLATREQLSNLKSFSIFSGKPMGSHLWQSTLQYEKVSPDLKSKLHLQSVTRGKPKALAEIIGDVVAEEEAHFLNTLQNRHKHVLTEIVEKAIPDHFRLERIFNCFLLKSRPFPLKELFSLIPNDLACKLVQCIVQNEKLHATVDLLSLIPLYGCHALKVAIDESESDFNFARLKDEITFGIKRSRFRYATLNLLLHILLEKNKRIPALSPVKPPITDLVDFIKLKLRLLKLYVATLFYAQSYEKLKIQAIRLNETVAWIEGYRRGLLNGEEMDFEEIVQDFCESNTMFIEDRQLEEQFVFEEVLRLLETEPDLTCSLFRCPQFRTLFTGKELLGFALIDETIANCLLDTLIAQFKSRELFLQDIKELLEVYPHFTVHFIDTIILKYECKEINFKNIETLITVYPDMTYPILQRLNLGCFQLLSIADCHPKAANAILQTAHQFKLLIDLFGLNDCLVLLAKKHRDTAKYIFSDSTLSEQLTEGNVLEIAAFSPQVIEYLLANKAIMGRVSDKAKVVLNELFDQSGLNPEMDFQSLRLG
ncbi:hypothetical protein EAS68_04515 [Legionella jordanis]|uniref:hypothetical protein n=1 Tax=Legionella jordanis TaxID=456 RepID=UPI000EFE4CD8|nr:hypothetical protein [Legionella jordanis]RMX20975.1 hypothetical protein EAS68_04515 [Legionella jordanis]